MAVNLPGMGLLGCEYLSVCAIVESSTKALRTLAESQVDQPFTVRFKSRSGRFALFQFATEISRRQVHLHFNSSLPGVLRKVSPNAKRTELEARLNNFAGLRVTTTASAGFAVPQTDVESASTGIVPSLTRRLEVKTVTLDLRGAFIAVDGIPPVRRIEWRRRESSTSVLIALDRKSETLDENYFDRLIQECHELMTAVAFGRIPPDA